MGMNLLEAAVYVPAYNAAPYLAKCLAGIQAQTYPVKEIVVVDDGSSDDSAAIAEAMNVRVIKQPVNMGLANARRRAFNEIECPLLAALDADCVPEPEWLEILVENMKNPAVAGTSGKLLELPSELPADRWRRAHMEQHWGKNYIASPLMLFGNNTLFRRQAILEAGNYPTSACYRTNNEDYYISRRLRERGYRVIYNPAARVYHHRRDTENSLFRTYWNWFFLHKPRPDSVRGLWRKTKDNIWWTAEFMQCDWRAKDWKLLGLSWRFLFAQARLDLEYYFRINA